MKNPPRKEPTAISFMAVQTELMRQLAREQIALAHETVNLIRELRELQDYVLRTRKAASATAGASKGKVIPFHRGGLIERIRAKSIH